MERGKPKFLFAVVCVLTVVACDPLAQDPKYQLDLEREYEDQRVRELAHAAAIARVKRIEQLVSEGVDVNALGNRGYTPLAWALKNEQSGSTGTLLRLGADPNIAIRGNSPMGIAIQYNDNTSLRLMLEHGGDPNLGDDNRSPLLLEAIENGNMEALRLLVDAGSRINVRGPQGDTPVIFGARHNRYEAVYFLLQNGADYRAVNRYGHTLMHYIEVLIYPPMAGVDYRAKVIEFLRAEGVEVSGWDEDSG